MHARAVADDVRRSVTLTLPSLFAGSGHAKASTAADEYVARQMSLTNDAATPPGVFAMAAAAAGRGRFMRATGPAPFVHAATGPAPFVNNVATGPAPFVHAASGPAPFVRTATGPAPFVNSGAFLPPSLGVSHEVANACATTAHGACVGTVSSSSFRAVRQCMTGTKASECRCFGTLAKLSNFGLVGPHCMCEYETSRPGMATWSMYLSCTKA